MYELQKIRRFQAQTAVGSVGELLLVWGKIWVSPNVKEGMQPQCSVCVCGRLVQIESRFKLKNLRVIVNRHLSGLSKHNSLVK